MMLEDHWEVNQCAGVGHYYVNVTVVRCGHRESYTTRGSVWCDTPDGETYEMGSREIQHGPFDDPEEIKRATIEVTRWALEALVSISV